MELMSILINQKAWQFLLVLSAAPISRFLFRSLEPSPRDLKESPTSPGIVEGDGTWRCYPDWFETPGWNLVKFWGEPLASRFLRADDFRMHFLLGQVVGGESSELPEANATMRSSQHLWKVLLTLVS